MTDHPVLETLAQSSFPLVGREREWQALLDRCARLRCDQGGLLCLAGEAGIGKTALLEQLRAWAGQNDLIALWGRHLGHLQAPPLHGLRQALSPLFQLGPTDGPAEVERKVHATLARRWPGLELHRRALVQFLEPLAGYLEPEIGSAGRGPHLYHLLFRLLVAAAAEKPLLLFLDDFHWADATTLEGLRYLAPLLADRPILLLLAYRPEEEGVSFQGLDLEKYCETMPLSRLDREGVAAMAACQGLGSDPLFCQKLHQLTEGVPLFVEQWLLECRRRPAGQPARQFLEQRPEPITRTIARRLHHLSADELRLLQAAAVLGDPFSAPVLHRVDGRPLAQVLPLLAHLEERHRLLRCELAALRERRFAFHHALIRQVLYEALPQALRQELHARAAQALEEVLPSRPDAIFAVGHHYVAAQLNEKAAQVLFQAGRRSLALHAHPEARSYCEQALEALGPSPQAAGPRAEIREVLGEVAFAQGELEEARAFWRAALQEQADPLRRCDLCRKLGLSWQRSDFRQQWHYYQLGLKESQDHPHSLERAQVLAELMLVPDPDSQRPHSRSPAFAAQALRILRRHPRRDVLARVLIARLPLFFIYDPRNVNLKRKRRLVSRGIRLAEELEDWSLAIEGRAKLAETWQGIDLETALGMTEDALRLAESYLPPEHEQLKAVLHRLLRWSLAHSDPERVARYGARLGAAPGTCVPGMEPHQWQAYPRQAWDFHVRLAHKLCVQFGFLVLLAKQLTRLQRLACLQGRPEDYRALVAELRQKYPAYFSNLPDIQWEPEPAEPAPEALEHIPRLGLSDLRWKDPARNSGHQFLSKDEVEIAPGPGIGLGWGRSAPCLLCRVEGDFIFAARFGPGSHARRGGGMVVWDSDGRFIRFASGIDHVGQVSLGWHDGEQLRYAGLGYCPEHALYLRLFRQGRQYHGLISPDGQTWHTCGRLKFGGEGPVEVGLFAEANYEYGFPQPFPIRFTEIGLWVRAPETTAPAVPLAAQSYLYPLPQVTELFCGMVGQDRAFQHFCRQLREASRSSLPLLIIGETGTGKEMAAQAVHQLSQHKNGPYIPVNVAALPQGLIESELFGHKKGAFTGATHDHPGLFAAASGGTLFLDEIGELPLDMQAHLLRVLDSGEIRALGSTQVRHVDVRILAATHCDLARQVAEGRFRQDLYFRFADPVLVPPLRQRRADIPYLVAFFLSLYGQGARYGMASKAMQRLIDHDWPDNVRGLKQVIERAVLSLEGDLILVEHLSLRAPLAPAAPVAAPPAPRRQRPSPEELRRIGLEHRGNVAALSRHFGVSRLTIYRWFESCGLDLQELRSGAGD
jgi:transcriptional regulator with AAA-type ATPase domain/tetratricopeptide (TPR) repeat protein